MRWLHAVPLLLLLAVAPAQAGPWDASAATDIQVDLATVAPGHHDPNAWYGHAALLVSDDATGVTRYYTYRLYWPDDQPRAVASVTDGAVFRLEGAPIEWALDEYGTQGRAMRLARLDLGAGVGLALAEALEDEVGATRDRPHPYHPIEDNCSTRIRDLVDEAIGGVLRRATQGEAAQSARDLFSPYLAHDAAMTLAIHFLVGPGADRPLDRWQAMFLPEWLEREVLLLTVGGADERPLAAGVTQALPQTQPLHDPVRVWPWAGAVSVIAALGAAWLGWRARGGDRLAHRAVAAYGVAVGAVVFVPAVILLILWTGPDSSWWDRNSNLLLASPFALGLLPAAVLTMWRPDRGMPWLRRVAAVSLLLASLGLVVKLLPWWQQTNGAYFAFFLPAYAGLALAAGLADATWRRPRWATSAVPDADV